MRPWAAMRRKGFCIDSLWRYFGFRAMFCDRLKSEEVTPGAYNTHPNVLCCKLEQATLQPTTYTRDRTEGHVFPGVRLNRNRRKLNSIASSIQIMDGMGKSIPLARAPHDQIRFGFSSFAQDASNGHPLEAINKSRVANEFDFKMDTARKVYGSAFVMRMKTEVAALSQAQRLPGLPSSMLGLETVLGRDETLEFEDYFDLPAERPVAPRFEVHHAMEVQYGLL